MAIIGNGLVGPRPTRFGPCAFTDTKCTHIAGQVRLDFAAGIVARCANQLDLPAPLVANTARLGKDPEES
ncbi:hypothetical protein GCM10023156_43110 [Novipirellula rosea]|uniref:Uncharacterized protein n=1 Tax=Novipirellula rosea TaxID=1031540 RepID=A0ABP8N8N5_9BACT